MKASPALALLFFWCLAACDNKPGPGPGAASSTVPATPSAIASVLGLDAGLFAEATDPPAPAGDLKADLERFVNVDTCVKERANLDPLVGDGLRAMGYDTFLRDACRLLEAAKDKKAETCDRIDASAMRERCKTWVAMVTQTPDACPLQFDGVLTRGRDRSCVAVAGKDPRLCNAEPRAAARATCEALASRDEARCATLQPAERPACVRELTRWKSLLAAPLAGLPRLPEAHGKLTVKGEAGTPDPATGETDLASEVTRGAVVVTSRDRARVEIGIMGETSRLAPSPNRRPRVGVAVLLEAGATAKDAGRPVLERLELEIPGEATLVFPGVRCECKVTTARVDRARGGEVSLVVSGTLSAGTRSYAVTIDVGTWVRDVVSEQTGAGTPGRVIPGAHPFVPGAGTLDAGLR